MSGTTATEQRDRQGRDPRRYIDAGRRLAVRKSDYLAGWWVSHSPRNGNQNAEGEWAEWVALARAILAADEEYRRIAPVCACGHWHRSGEDGEDVGCWDECGCMEFTAQPDAQEDQ